MISRNCGKIGYLYVWELFYRESPVEMVNAGMVTRLELLCIREGNSICPASLLLSSSLASHTSTFFNSILHF